MNKYIYIFIAAVSVFFGAACSSDNDLPAYATGLKVVKAETDFGVLGETHEVVMSKEPARAYALDAWLTVTKTAEKLSLTAQRARRLYHTEYPTGGCDLRVAYWRGYLCWR